MDAVTRILLAVGLSLFSAIACAKEAATPYEPTEKEILQFALEQMNTAVDALDERERECAKGRKRVLDPALMKSIPLSNSEWRIALSALVLRAVNKCGEDGGRALMALMRFKAAEEHYKGKNSIKTRYYPEDLSGSWETEITAELKYQRLDPQVRKTLESIPELNEPFNLIATVDAWGIFKE